MHTECSYLCKHKVSKHYLNAPCNLHSNHNMLTSQTAVSLIYTNTQYVLAVQEGSVNMAASSTSIASQNYHFRPQAHSQQLPQHTAHLSDSNFIPRILITDIY